MDSGKKKVTVYVKNKDLTPSSYYRIVQYTKHFMNDVSIREVSPRKIYELHVNYKKNNILKLLIKAIYYLIMLIRVSYYLTIDCINKPEYIIVSKSFCSRYTPFFLGFLIKKATTNSKFYWDFDDFIFQSGEISKKEAKILEETSNKIIVTNKFLKSKISIENQKKVLMLPTTDGDFQDYNPEELKIKRKATYDEEIHLVWVGTSASLPNLEYVASALDKAAYKIKHDHKKNLILKVVCNKPLEVNSEDLKIVNIKWTRDVAKEQIYNSHIGIMPLRDNEYSLGKGGFKLIQYMSTGLPVIASNVGYNKEVINDKIGILVDDTKNDDVWSGAIVSLCYSWDKWEIFSENSLHTWNNKFSFNKNLRTWNELLSN